MKYICIYCKELKEENEFNREHVVPRMMGRYTNGLVLSEHQVCQKCNSYFSSEVENKISLDSYEAFLRMKSGTKKMSEGKRIGHTRIKLLGADGIFKGLPFTAVSDTSEDRMHFEIDKCVGFKISDDEYEYCRLEDVTEATEERLNELKKYSVPIIHFGYEQREVQDVLTSKGYINKNATCSTDGLEQRFNSKDFTTSIKLSVDSFARRVCAKTVFNYICLNSSSEELLKPQYDLLRRYIRYGEWNDDLWFRMSMGFVSAAVPPNATSHVVGTMIYPSGDGVELLGCVTWFGEITYIFKICNIESNDVTVLPNGQIVHALPYINTKFTYFDNESTKVIDENATFIYGGR